MAISETKGISTKDRLRVTAIRVVPDEIIRYSVKGKYIGNSHVSFNGEFVKSSALKDFIKKNNL